MSRLSTVEHKQHLDLVVPLVATAVSACALYVSLAHLRESWDDGAITAAFAQTLAHSGRMALTPASGSVEGSSSILWTLLLTIPEFISRGHVSILVWMKIVAVVAFLVSIVLFHRLSKQVLGESSPAFTATLLLALMISPFHEAYNGMEMTLYLLLVIAFTTILLDESSGVIQVLLASTLGSLLILDRFEAPFLLCCILGALAYCRPLQRKTYLSVAFLCLVFLLLTETWRYYEFGLLVPNTVLAKRWPPYQPNHTLFALTRNRLIALYEIVFVLIGPLIAAGVMFLFLRRKGANSKVSYFAPDTLFLTIIVLGEFVFSLLLGRNWGHFGRMTLGFAPFFVLLFVRVCWTKLNGYPKRTKQIYSLVVISAQLVLWLVLIFPSPRETTSIALYETEGLFAEQVRQLARRPVLTAMLPDVGGAALCCIRLRILDAALLTNDELAKYGYSVEPAYFDKTRPEFVVAHFPWSSLGAITRSNTFASYGLATWKGQTAFLRPDVYAAVRDAGVPEIDSSRDPGCQNEAYGYFAEDTALTQGHPRCLSIPAKR